MKFYEFGNMNNPVIMLLPGTCCHWRANFGDVIPLLEQNFRVVCVSYDGFDETEQTEFTDMITETAKIEEYIKKNHNGSIKTAYGCSLGGSFVGLLIQRKKIHIEHGIIGSSDLDQASRPVAWLQTKLMTPILYPMLHSGKMPNFMKSKVEKSENKEYMEKFMNMFGIGNGGYPFITKRSVKNQFYSDLVTRLEDHIEVPGTTIHCFYAKKMGEQYLKRYEKHFKNPDIITDDLEHEELLCCYKEKWAARVERISQQWEEFFTSKKRAEYKHPLKAANL